MILRLTAVLAVLAFPASAHAHKLSKRTARTEAQAFISPFVDMLDTDRYVATQMVPPRRCRRISRATVRCRFHAKLHDGRTVRNFVRVHRQRDGLLGFYTTLDVFADGVQPSPAAPSAVPSRSR